MTIADKFLEKERVEKEQREQERRDYAKNLGERINKALLDPVLTLSESFLRITHF